MSLSKSRSIKKDLYKAYPKVYCSPFLSFRKSLEEEQDDKTIVDVGKQVKINIPQQTPQQPKQAEPSQPTKTQSQHDKNIGILVKKLKTAGSVVSKEFEKFLEFVEPEFELTKSMKFNKSYKFKSLRTQRIPLLLSKVLSSPFSRTKGNLFGLDPITDQPKPSLDPPGTPRYTLPPIRYKSLEKKKDFVIGNYTIKFVDGLKIRNSSSEHQEFSSGHIHEDFPKLIPQNEIWIDIAQKGNDAQHSVDGQMARLAALEAGKDADEAYNIGKRTEAAMRVTEEKTVNRQVARGQIWCTLGDATRVLIVDPNLVRDIFKDDFEEGGNAEVYSFIPPGEIWVDKNIQDGEKPYIIYHEFVERDLMRTEDLDYDDAHERASKAEWKARQKGLTKADLFNLGVGSKPADKELLPSGKNGKGEKSPLPHTISHQTKPDPTAPDLTPPHHTVPDLTAFGGVNRQSYYSSKPLKEKGNSRRKYGLVPPQIKSLKPEGQPESLPDYYTKSLEEKHDYGCLLAPLPEPLRKEIVDWCLENIPDFHLFDKDSRELRPHITVLYGFKDSDSETLETVRMLLARKGPLSIQLGKLGLFTGGSDGDVLHIEVSSTQLEELNQEIRDTFDVKIKFEEYRPHVTIAYIDPKISHLYANESVKSLNWDRKSIEEQEDVPEPSGSEIKLQQPLTPSLKLNNNIQPKISEVSVSPFKLPTITPEINSTTKQPKVEHSPRKEAIKQPPVENKKVFVRMGWIMDDVRSGVLRGHWQGQEYQIKPLDKERHQWVAYDNTGKVIAKAAFPQQLQDQVESILGENTKSLKWNVKSGEELPNVPEHPKLEIQDNGYASMKVYGRSGDRYIVLTGNGKQCKLVNMKTNKVSDEISLDSAKIFLRGYIELFTDNPEPILRVLRGGQVSPSSDFMNKDLISPDADVRNADWIKEVRDRRLKAKNSKIFEEDSKWEYCKEEYPMGDRRMECFEDEKDKGEEKIRMPKVPKSPFVRK